MKQMTSFMALTSKLIKQYFVTYAPHSALHMINNPISSLSGDNACVLCVNLTVRRPCFVRV